MKKCLFLLALLLVTAQYAMAQPRDVQHCEGDVHVGATMPAGSFHDGDKQVGGNLGLEFRYNLGHAKLPLDFGLGVDVVSSVYHFHSNDEHSGGDQSNRTFAVQALCDYNFNQGHNVAPFVGLGMGVGRHDVINDNVYEAGDGEACFVVTPRVGVELVHHIRLTLNATLSRKGYNAFGLSLGFVLGGRPKK